MGKDFLVEMATGGDEAIDELTGEDLDGRRLWSKKLAKERLDRAVVADDTEGRLQDVSFYWTE